MTHLSINHHSFASCSMNMPPSFPAAPPQLCQTTTFPTSSKEIMCNTSIQQNHQPLDPKHGRSWHPVGPSGLSPDLENYQILVHESEDPHAHVVPYPLSWQVGKLMKEKKHLETSINRQYLTQMGSRKFIKCTKITTINNNQNDLSLYIKFRF